MSYHKNHLYRFVLVSGVALGLLATGSYQVNADSRTQSNNNANQFNNNQCIISFGSLQPGGSQIANHRSELIPSRTVSKYSQILNGMNHHYNQAKVAKPKETASSHIYMRKHLRNFSSSDFNAGFSRGQLAHISRISRLTRHPARALSDHNNSDWQGQPSHLKRTFATKNNEKATKNYRKRSVRSSYGNRLSYKKHSIKLSRKSKLNYKKHQFKPREHRLSRVNRAVENGLIGSSEHQTKSDDSLLNDADDNNNNLIIITPKKQARKVHPIKQSKSVQLDNDASSSVKNQVGDWFRDGLSDAELNARNWISWRESNNNWNILSYGGYCIGYFQLSPSYLGWINGHLNLDHKHQVRVADRYAKSRYGGWLSAKRFWLLHHWY